jgi:uncharacterized protein (DUF302 family)
VTAPPPDRRRAAAASSATSSATSSALAYCAIRLRYDSVHGFDETRARFDARVPALDPMVNVGLVLARAPWAEVVAAAERTAGPADLVALTRLDTGALLSLSGASLEATLYLVGNPVMARRITALDPAGALYAPFRVLIHRDPAGVHVDYDLPSSVFASLGSAEVDAIAADLDGRIRGVVEDSCR